MKRLIVGIVLFACGLAVVAESALPAKNDPPSPPELEAAWDGGLMIQSPCEESLDGLDRAELEKRAEAGDAKAAMYVAMRCFGEEGAYDLPKTRAWAERAAKGGLDDGQLVFAEFLYFGLGGPTNDAEAVRWFRIASTNNCPAADYWLGRCYAEGRGVEKDLKRAERQMRKLTPNRAEEHVYECDEARGRANEWLWDHGFTPDLPTCKGMAANGKVDFNAPQPPSCADSDRDPIDYGKEVPLFLPDAKAAILVADPEGKAFDCRTWSIFDSIETGLSCTVRELRWAALSILDLTLHSEEEYDSDEYDRSFRPTVDFAVALRLADETPALTNECFKAFKENDFEGWDVRLTKRMGFSEFAMEPCVSRTKGGVLLFASSRRTLRRMVELYRDGGGGYPDIAKFGAKALAFSIPETGKFLQGVYGGVRADHDHALATWCANGSLLIDDLGASSFTASLSKKGFLKLKLSFDARNERDAALLRRPLVYYAQRFAADASAQTRVPSWVKDLTAHLRVVVKGRTVTVETYCKFRELVSEVKAMASESRR